MEALARLGCDVNEANAVRGFIWCDTDLWHDVDMALLWVWVAMCRLGGHQ